MTLIKREMIKKLLEIKNRSLKVVMAFFDEHPLILALHFSMIPFVMYGVWFHNWLIIIPSGLILCGTSFSALLFQKEVKKEMKIKFLNVVTASLENPFIFILHIASVFLGLIALWFHNLPVVIFAIIILIGTEASSLFLRGSRATEK